MVHRRKIRSPAVLARALALLAVLGLAGCSADAIAAPPAPTTTQIPSLMSVWPDYEAGLINYNSPATLTGVSFVRFVADSDWVRVMTSCTARFGVTDIVYHPDHTSSAEATSTPQQWKRDLANGSCIIEYPPVSVRARLKTPQQLDYIYSYYTNELLPCMRTAGVTVAKLPSRARFHLISRNGFTLWSPYSSIGSSPLGTDSVIFSDGLAQVPIASHAVSHATTALLGKCPPLPPGVA